MLLIFSYLDPTNAGNYTVVVSNAAGAVTSSVAVVSVNATSHSADVHAGTGQHHH